MPPKGPDDVISDVSITLLAFLILPRIFPASSVAGKGEPELFYALNLGDEIRSSLLSSPLVTYLRANCRKPLPSVANTLNNRVLELAVVCAQCCAIKVSTGENSLTVLPIQSKMISGN